MDCGFDSACLGAITVIAQIVRRPDNRFHYFEVSGVPSSEPVAFAATLLVLGLP